MPDATPAKFPNKPDDVWALHQYTAIGLVINDQRSNEGPHEVRVCAYGAKGNWGGAYVVMGIEANGFDARSANTPGAARALAAALIEAADLCDAFEADLTIREEQETARLNAGPINAIEIGGGVVAFEDAGEVAA